jgi:hypothetical protein
MLAMGASWLSIAVARADVEAPPPDREGSVAVMDRGVSATIGEDAAVHNSGLSNVRR